MFDKTLYNVCMGIQVGNSKQHYELFYMNPSHTVHSLMKNFVRQKEK